MKCGGQLDGEPEVRRRLGGPPLEVPLGGQSVARRVQLDGRKPLRVAAEELRRLRVGGVETGLPARVREAGSSDIGACYPRPRGSHARSLCPERELSAVLDHGFVRLDGVMADDLSVVNSCAGRASRRRGVTELADDRRGSDQVPDARAPRHAVRAQLVPVPRSLPDLRRARVVPAPHRLVQRVLVCAMRGRPTTSTCPSPTTCGRRSASRGRTRSNRSTSELAEYDA